MKKYKISILIIGMIVLFTTLSYSATPREKTHEKKRQGTKVLVGAIRWDAWIGDTKNGISVGLQVERSLSPHKFHYRAPFFSKEIGPDSMQSREITQDVMDQDIAYANYAGINYWAFVYYKNGSGMDIQRNLYLNSKVKLGLRWCLIIGSTFDANELVWLINQFKRSDYQKVFNQRPLLYLLEQGKNLKPDQLALIRKLSAAAGLNDPYIVLMSSEYVKPNIYADSLGVNALSRYNSSAGKNGSPYFPDIPNADKNGWEDMKKTGAQVVPWVTAGRNMKPRIERSVSWQKIPADRWAADGTPEQIADNLQNSILWVKNNQQTCAANTVIIYAWNEFDEGGWICPTFGGNTDRIRAIRNVLKN
ncbi:hypothetical protein [Mucilaginibacter sp.]|uniref:hypothetical protein n=1 Tax=Mucilaginibacter sp. TaxID=1882438 RepID=UPI00283F5C9D|nr:hypothetical protein [Mucilaginibacter sp.]MDR3696315.1 hypothetical protein [Mucilaginibacter sp.]